MTRKHLLSDLVGAKTASQSGDTAAPQFSARGAVGAVSRSIEMLRSQALIDLDPDLIDAPKVVDRLEEDPDHFEAFARQIRENGQQVPILVRPHPQVEGRYQIAYGRRRLKAVKALGGLVKAAVKPLSDDEFVLAQGQENSQRHDLSFIERGLYAAELEANGFSRAVIMGALGIDKTGLSRLISAASAIPPELVRAIGPAPRAGRDRWMEFANRLNARGAMDIVLARLDGGAISRMSSDERFNHLFNLIRPREASTTSTTVWKADDGAEPLRYKQDRKSLTIVLDKTVAPNFGDYLLAAMPELYASFKRRGE